MMDQNLDETSQTDQPAEETTSKVEGSEKESTQAIFFLFFYFLIFIHKLSSKHSQNLVLWLLQYKIACHTIYHFKVKVIIKALKIITLHK